MVARVVRRVGGGFGGDGEAPVRKADQLRPGDLGHRTGDDDPAGLAGDQLPSGRDRQLVAGLEEEERGRARGGQGRGREAVRVRRAARGDDGGRVREEPIGDGAGNRVAIGAGHALHGWNPRADGGENGVRNRTGAADDHDAGRGQPGDLRRGLCGKSVLGDEKQRFAADGRGGRGGHGIGEVLARSDEDGAAPAGRERAGGEGRGSGVRVRTGDTLDDRRRVEQSPGLGQDGVRDRGRAAHHLDPLGREPDEFRAHGRRHG